MNNVFDKVRESKLGKVSPTNAEHALVYALLQVASDLYEEDGDFSSVPQYTSGDQVKYVKDYVQSRFGKESPATVYIKQLL